MDLLFIKAVIIGDHSFDPIIVSQFTGYICKSWCFCGIIYLGAGYFSFKMSYCKLKKTNTLIVDILSYTTNGDVGMKCWVNDKNILILCNKIPTLQNVK